MAGMGWKADVPRFGAAKPSGADSPSSPNVGPMPATGSSAAVSFFAPTQCRKAKQDRIGREDHRPEDHEVDEAAVASWVKYVAKTIHPTRGKRNDKARANSP